MNNKAKTKEQLTDELTKLRQRLTNYEKVKTDLEQAKEGLVKSETRYQSLIEKSGAGIATADKKGKFTYVNDALQESEQKYRNLVERANDGIVIIQDRKIVYANPRMEEIIGYRKNELENSLFTNYLPPDELPKVVNRYKQRMAGREVPSKYESIVLDKQGREIFVEFNASVITYQGKQADIVIVRDITERKRMEEELRKSKELFEKTFISQRDAIFILDTKNPPKIINYNPAAIEIFGYKREEILGRTTAFLHIDESALRKFQKHLYKSIEERGFLYLLEFKMKRKGGTIFPTEHSVLSLKDEQGKHIGWVSLVRDITDRKRAEKALRESEEKYRSLVENTDDPIYLVDKNCKYLFMNTKYLSRLGLSLDHMVGKVYSKFHSKKETEIFYKNINRVFKTGESITHEHQSRRDGRFFYRTYSPVKDEEGKVKAVTTISKDITELKKTERERGRLQKQLIQSEKMAGIGTLTSGIAHEFNNLLQIMRGHAEYAQRTKKPEDMEEALDVVESTSDRATKIIKDLLTFSRREPTEKELCHIVELVEFVLSLTEEQLKKHNIKVVREYRKIPYVEVNKGEIQQVFLNMVTNARDAMRPKGGRLAIKVKKVKGKVEVSFTDTGRGIEKDNLGRVFEPFYTTKGAVGGDSKIQGLGLGLSVSYGIVERHEGTIEVESEAGKGATFIVKLPAKGKKAQKRKAKAASKAKKKTLKPQKILVVDDEREICQMFKKLLSPEGHQVKSAYTGKQAINLAKKDYYDIVFLDLIMPGIPGIEVLEKVKEISSKTKVIIITGSLMKDKKWERLKQKGASGFIQKPFKSEDIKKCLETL